MGKIVASSLVVLAVAVAVGNATYSFFSDSETSNNNTFTAGSIDLSISSQFSSNGNANTSPISLAPSSDNNGRALYTFTDLKPGDFGRGSFGLNVTSNESYACARTIIDATPDNGIVDPEGDAGDVTDGTNAGELQNFLQFATFADLNGNGQYDGGEPLNVNQYNGGDSNGFTVTEMEAAGWVPVADTSSPNTWLTIGSLAPGPVYHAGFMYCFGNFDTNGVCSMTMSSNDNIAQTDGISGSLEFQAVQTRNNEGFLCSDQPITMTVGANDLAENFSEIVSAPYSWFFYNDSNDTVMPINQFGPTGVNDIVAGPSAEGAAQMTLHDAAGRYNIATYKYKDVKLSDIGSLKYRIYDASASAETPYLHFNVDFNNSDTWQRRLVQVPTGVVANTWTTVDALAGMWTLSGGNWPAGGSETGANPGSTPKTWASIVADYPVAETRSTDSFLGVRVGHPGPIGEDSFVDWIEFDGETTDFEN